MQGELEELIAEARARGGIEFIFTLVRVEGMSFGTPDSLEALRRVLASDHPPREEILRNDEPLRILANLLRCARSERFSIFAGDDLRSDHGLADLAAKANAAGFLRIAKALNTPDELDGLFRALLDAIDEQRRSFLSYSRLYKLPDFAVLELLVDDEIGLTGFRVHHSNDEKSEFVRSEMNTSPLNISFDDQGCLILIAGDLEALTNEWRVNGRPLYEVGLPGRYNPVGTWQPLVFPTDWSAQMQSAKAGSERPEVQGALLYIFLTGHRALEFAACTSLELPHETVTFGGGRIELHHLETAGGLSSEQVYDGTLYLPGADAEDVERGLEAIQSLLNRLAFAFDAEIHWVPKYSTVNRDGGRATPSEEDLQMLDHLLEATDAPGREVIDQAIDWYNRGRAASNVFVAFLCSYIALESLAIAAWSGEVEIDMDRPRQTKHERREERRRCIDALHEARYEEDPEAFVAHAYFQCVVPLARRVAQVAEKIFGTDSRPLRLLFHEGSRQSLGRVRSDLAHGRLSLSDPQAQELVWNRLGDMQEVAREFLLRVALGLRPDESVPEWSRLHRIGMDMTDPRATLVASSLRHLPPSDWRIRADWIQ